MDGAQVEISWEAPTPGCATEAEFRKALEERLGYDPVRSTATRRIGVRLTRHEGERYEVVVTENDAVRAFEGACQDVVDDAALATAMALDPLRAHAPPSKPPAAAAVAPAPVLAARPAAPRLPRKGPWIELGAAAGLAFRHVPDASPRLGIEAAVAWTRLRFAVQGEAGLASSLDRTVLGRTIAVDVRPLRAALHVDYSVVKKSRFALGPLAGFSIERLAVAGRGSDRDASSSVAVWRAALGARATFRLTGSDDEAQRGLRLVLDGAGAAALGSTTLVVRSAQNQLELWSVPVLGAMVRVGASWRF